MLKGTIVTIRAALARLADKWEYEDTGEIVYFLGHPEHWCPFPKNLDLGDHNTVVTLAADLARRLVQSEFENRRLRAENYWLRAEGSQEYDGDSDSTPWGFSEN